jgi:hypothetical protein
MGRAHIFAVDLARLELDRCLEGVAGRQDGGLVGRVLGVEQALVLLDRVLGVDGQPDRRLVAAPGQASSIALSDYILEI